MKKILILLLSLFSVAISAQQKKVAVYVIGQQSGITKVLGDQLVVAFAKSGKYEAVERTNSFLAELSKEQNYQRSGAVNDNDIARLGIQFGVNYVCVADMSDVFGEKYISARLIDVETAVVLNAHNVSGKMSSMNECLNMASEIADYLSRGTFKEQEEIEKRRAAEELRERQLEQERLKAQRERDRLQQLKNDGYVDLGLPSGTWWKYAPESTIRIQFAEIVNKKQLPTQKQMEELLSVCTWKRNGYNFIVVGPNGNTISFPYITTFKDFGVMHYAGYYWTKDYDAYLYFCRYKDKQLGPKMLFSPNKAVVRYVCVP